MTQSFDRLGLSRSSRTYRTRTSVITAHFTFSSCAHVYMLDFRRKGHVDTLTEGRSSQTGLQCLRHGQVAAVGQRRLHQLLLHAQVLEAVVELGVGHLNGKLLEDVGLLGVEVEAHLAEPLEGFGVVDLVLDQSSGHVSLMNQLCDLWRGEKK